MVLRSGPSYAVSDRHHLIGPIRPTRGHIATSPHGGLYAMPSLCRSAEATHVTTATGLLCWRDSHPLECQLASLHQIRTCGFPAYGSYLRYLTAVRLV